MANVVVGQLDPVDYVPKPVQPGGIGTPVTMPTQTVAEHNGRFMPGCGHSIMAYEVDHIAISGVPSALVKCPLCGWIQSIWTPASLLDQIPFIFG